MNLGIKLLFIVKINQNGVIFWGTEIIHNPKNEILLLKLINHEKKGKSPNLRNKEANQQK